MKKFILIVGALLLVGCGPSQQEKERVAQVACSEIMATRNFEEARRISILNDALLELGRDPYYSSSLFETQLVLGGTRACKDIINPPPPPTKAELKAQKEAQKEAKKAAEERRKKKEEEERIAAAEAEREAEERKKYVLENQVSTYLYCPLLRDKLDRQENIAYLLINLNKLDGELVESEIYTMYKTVDKEDSQFFVNQGCRRPNYDRSYNIPYIRKPKPCAEIMNKDGYKDYLLISGWVKNNNIPYEHVFERYEESSSYGHKALAFGELDSSIKPVLDRVDLGAAIDAYDLGDKYDGSPYQCEVTSKEIYEAKIQEQQNLIDDLVETTKQEKAERESEEPQI